MVRKLLVAAVVMVVLIIGYAVYLKFTGGGKPEDLIFRMAKNALPNASWSAPQKTTEQTPIGTLTGQKITGTITTKTAIVPHFDNLNTLAQMGYTVDNNLAADGPGSSQWAYTNAEGQTILYSYRVAGTSHPNEPIQFNCPCRATVSVFVSSPSNSATGLANPASVNCAKVGGTTVIKTNSTGGQYGLCEFEDNMACEEWALMRGQCPVGGVKTTGYDNIQQMYCAWVGGTTLAVPNAKCTLPNGTTCPVDTLYSNGSCNY